MRKHFSVAPPEKARTELIRAALGYNESGFAGFIEKRLSGQRPFLPLCGTTVFLLGIYLMLFGKMPIGIFDCASGNVRTESGQRL